MTPLTDTELSELEGLAEKANPGPWRFEEHGYCWLVDGNGGTILHVDDSFTCPHRDDANARFIAAANPSRIRALVGELRQAREREQSLRTGKCDLCDEHAMSFGFSNAKGKYQYCFRHWQNPSLSPEETVKKLRQELARVEAERDALREALERLLPRAEKRCHCTCGNDERSACSDCHLHAAITKSRAALAGSKPAK